MKHKKAKPFFKPISDWTLYEMELFENIVLGTCLAVFMLVVYTHI